MLHVWAVQNFIAFYSFSYVYVDSTMSFLYSGIVIEKVFMPLVEMVKKTVFNRGHGDMCRGHCNEVLQWGKLLDSASNIAWEGRNL